MFMTLPALSIRGETVPASPIRKLVPHAVEAKAKGVKVFQLNIGEPDIASPQEFFDGIRAFKEPLLAYEQSAGNPDLKTSWSDYANKTLNLETRPDNFMITTGGSEGLLFSIMALTDPGDEVLVIEPTYANYLGFASMAGIKLVAVTSRIEDSFALPATKEIAAKINNKTRAIILCNPSNPSGALCSEIQVKQLIELCNERSLFLIVDEAYRDYAYDGRKPFSALQIDFHNPRLLVIDTLSKRFSLCGARLGAIISSNRVLLASALKFGQARLCSPTLEQFASNYMLRRVSEQYVNNIHSEFEHRRNVIVEALSAIDGVLCPKPAGAFFCLARLPVKNAEDFAKFMLTTFRHEGQTTFLAPANGFYVTPGLGQSEVRIAYVLNSGDLEKAIEILGLGLQAYLRSH